MKAAKVMLHDYFSKIAIIFVAEKVAFQMNTNLNIFEQKSRNRNFRPKNAIYETFFEPYWPIP